MRLKKVINEAMKENVPSISVFDLQNVDKNILLFLKDYQSMDKNLKDNFLKSIIGQLQELSKKINGTNKYDRFIQRLVDPEQLVPTLLKIVDFNKKLIREKENENIQAKNNRTGYQTGQGSPQET